MMSRTSPTVTRFAPARRRVLVRFILPCPQKVLSHPPGFGKPTPISLAKINHGPIVRYSKMHCPVSAVGSINDRSACSRRVRHAHEINNQQKDEGVRKFVTVHWGDRHPRR